MRGGYREELGRTTIEYDPLTLVFHPAEIRHRDEIGPRGAVFFTIELEETWQLARAPIVFGVEARLAALRLYSIFRRGAADELTIESTIALWSAAAMPPLSPKSGRMATALQIVRESFREPLTVNGIAQQIDVHPVSLSRAFRRQVGTTLGEYVNRLRVEWAARKLAQEEPVGLAELAAAAGFADQSHFTRVFRAYIGAPPGQVRTVLH